MAEPLTDHWQWWRVAENDWENPLDTDYARIYGGRWNPPNSFACLYLNEDIEGAHLNLTRFFDQHPYEPEDLLPEKTPVLVEVSLPRRQKVCDAHSAAGLRALGLPDSYPLDHAKRPLPHARCQSLGLHIQSLGLHGVLCLSAQATFYPARELAWFPTASPNGANLMRTLPFNSWFQVQPGLQLQEERRSPWSRSRRRPA